MTPGISVGRSMRRDIVVRNGLVGLAMVAWSTGTLLAQDEPQYETLPIAAEYEMPTAPPQGASREQVTQFNTKRNEVRTRRTEMQRQVKDTLRGRGGNAATMEPWFRGYVFPEMTQLDDSTLSRLGDIRERFFKDYFEDAINQNLRNQLIALTIPVMKPVAEGNFHPAARVNAVLLLGHLNSREGNRSGGVLPVPVEEVLPWLVQVASTDTWPEYLRVSAMNGIERHTRLRAPGSRNEIPETTAREIGDTMLALIERQPDEKASREAVYWMKRRAVQVMGHLALPGEGNRYAAALQNLVSSSSEKMLVRTEAVEAYSKLRFADPAQANAMDVIRQIGELVVAAANTDANYIDEKTSEIDFISGFFKETIKQSSGGGNRGNLGKGGGGNDDGGSGGGDSGGTTTGKKALVAEVLPEYHRELVRRRFKTWIWICRTALVGEKRSEDGGLFRFSNDAEKAFIKDLVKQFDNAMLATDVRAPDPDAPIDKKEDEKGGKKGGGLFPEDEPKPVTLAEQLKNALVKVATDVGDTVAKHVPDAAADNPLGGNQ